MLEKFRGWLSDRIFDLGWLIEPMSESPMIEIDIADCWPYGAGLARSRAEVETWFGRPVYCEVNSGNLREYDEIPELTDEFFTTASVYIGGKRVMRSPLEVDHVEARRICKALLGGLFVAVVALGLTWLAAAAFMHALGLV